jgi:cytochrome c-type biogenesis protein CcmH
MIGWLIAAAVLLTAATAWYLARAVVRMPAEAGEEFHQLAAVRERLLVQLRELEIEGADRNVDATIAADERTRLEAELAQVLRRLEELGAAPREAQAGPQASRRQWWMALGALALAMPLIAGGLYYTAHAPVLRVLAGGGMPQEGIPPEVMEMVTRLENRLREQPDNAEGWARLGRAYTVLERPHEALAAYERALKLVPDHLEALAGYAWLVYSKDPSHTGEPAFGLYTRLLRLDPENRDALWFLGLAAYQKGEFRKAIANWERLQKGLMPEDPAARHIATVLASAREKAAEAHKGKPAAAR